MFVKISSDRYININHITRIAVEDRLHIQEQTGKWRVWVSAPGQHHETFGFDDDGIGKLIVEINSLIRGRRPTPPLVDRPLLRME